MTRYKPLPVGERIRCLQTGKLGIVARHVNHGKEYSFEFHAYEVFIDGHHGTLRRFPGRIVAVGWEKG